MRVRTIGDISNYYGGLCVAERDGCYLWGIANYDWPFDRELSKEFEIPEDEYFEREIKYHFQEIPRQLYDALIAFDVAQSTGMGK